MRRVSCAIALGVGLPALGLLALVIYLLHSADLIRRTDAIIAGTHSVEKLLIDMESGLRGFQVTGDPQFLEPLKTAELRLNGESEALSAMVSESVEQGRSLAALRADIQVWQALKKKLCGPKKLRGQEA